MMAKTSNNLDDVTMDNIDQVNSIPIHMLTLVSMLIDGPGLSNRQFSTTCTNYSSDNSNKLSQKQKRWYATKLENSKEKRDSCSSIFNIENLWNLYI